MARKRLLFQGEMRVQLRKVAELHAEMKRTSCVEKTRLPEDIGKHEKEGERTVDAGAVQKAIVKKLHRHTVNSLVR